MTQEEKVELFNLGPIHLGDNIACTNIIYNLALQHGFKAKINYSNHFVGRHLMKIFDYQGKIEIVKRTPRLSFRFSVGRYLNTKNKSMWTARIFGASTFKPRYLEFFELPNCKLQPKEKKEKKEYKCYQVNSMSGHSGKPRLNMNEIKKTLKMFDEGNSYFISNVGTRIPIPDTKIHFANLTNQSKFLLGCKSFFGVDSGMSHLSGSLKVSGDIIVQGLSSNFTDCIYQAYGIMYPTLRVHSRKIFKHLPCL